MGGSRGKWYHDRAELIRKLEDAGGSVRKLSRESGATRDTISKWVHNHSINIETCKGKIPPTPVPIIHEQITLEGDAALTNDWHAPFTHYETLHRFLDDVQKHNLRNMIIAGDVTTQDSLADHEFQQEGAETEPEMESLYYSIDLALEVVETIYISKGNHDRHHVKANKVSFATSIKKLLAGMPPEKLARIKVTWRDSIIVETERGPWNVCHTRAYSKQPLAYPNRLAMRHNMHFFTGHRHHHAQGISANGKDIVEGGGMGDWDRMFYPVEYTNDMPQMQRGYGLLIDGFCKCPMLYS